MVYTNITIGGIPSSQGPPIHLKFCFCVRPQSDQCLTTKSTDVNTPQMQRKQSVIQTGKASPKWMHCERTGHKSKKKNAS